MNIQNIEAKKVSNGWILTVYEKDRNLFTTTVYVSAEQLIKNLTNLLFPKLGENKNFAILTEEDIDAISNL